MRHWRSEPTCCVHDVPHADHNRSGRFRNGTDGHTDQRNGNGRTVKRPKTPEQRIRDADARMDKLTDEVATLSRVLAAQNQATASIQREWRMWSDALLRIHTPEGIDAAKCAAQ